MNYDKYLEDSREAYEAKGDLPTKVWMVVLDGDEVCIEDDDYPTVSIYFMAESDSIKLGKSLHKKVEIGWIWDRDICQDWRKYFNVIESYGKENN